jgi:glycosyltransferase involved in cell wall biosynthesis
MVNQSMKVCFISFEYPPNVLGGVGTYAEAVVNGLKRRGVDVFVITRGEQNDYCHKIFRVPTSNVPYWRRLFFMKPALSLFHDLDKLIDFDLVHFNEPHIMLDRLGLPTVCTIHSTQINEIMLKLAGSKTLETTHDIRDLVWKGPIGSIFDVLKTRAADKIICPSPHLARLIRSYCFVDGQKISVIPNGINLKEFDKTEDYDTNVLRKYGLERGRYLLFVGRLSVLKGVHHLIEAFKTIKEEYSNLKLVIVGTGEFENHLKNLAYGIDDIVFTGYVDALAVKKSLYKNCVAVVVPSSYEGLPMVILEAMACKKTVIASDVGGIPLLIVHGKNGFLVKPGDSRSLEKFIRILLEDPDLRKNMGSFGRKLAEEKFTVDKTVCATLRVYKSLVKSPKICA